MKKFTVKMYSPKIMQRILRWLIPVSLRARLPIELQAWGFGEFVSGAHGSAMLLDNLTLTIEIDEVPEDA